MIDVGNDWQPLFDEEQVKPYYLELRRFLKGEYATKTIYPPMNDIFAAFRLTNGGQKVLYMTLKDIETHARTYSKSYVNYGKFPIPDAWKPNLSSTGLGWNKNWYAMARKTVLKLLIQRWGELSTEMEDAVASDQAAFNDIDSDPIYIDNNGEIVDDGTVRSYIVSYSDSSSTGVSAENVQEPAVEETMPEASSDTPVMQKEGNQGDIEKMFAAGARN